MLSNGFPFHQFIFDSNTVFNTLIDGLQWPKDVLTFMECAKRMGFSNSDF